jgi:cytidylate kinase
VTVSEPSDLCFSHVQGKCVGMNLVITISGLHGTGKSTIARAVSQAFNLRHVSAGELFRQIAVDRGLTVSDLSKLSATDRSVDDLVDERTRLEAKRGRVVLDGLLTGWLVKDEADLKIFFIASETARIERIARREGISFDAAREATLLREHLERRRFNRFYGVELRDLSPYDLVLNTGLLSVKANLQIIKTFIREYVKAYRRQ